MHIYQFTKKFSVMKNACLSVILFLAYLTSSGQTIYIVRHAEKASAAAMTSSSDPALSEAGSKRAEALKTALAKSGLTHIFSTNTIRTRSTAAPLAKALSLPIDSYGPMPGAAFIDSVKKLGKNVLIVGHSNTVDDLANGFAGRKVVDGDLADNEYDNLFVITFKGEEAVFERRKYGEKTDQ
jgi:broad specificity phosphatase PhoE